MKKTAAAVALLLTLSAVAAGQNSRAKGRGAAGARLHGPGSPKAKEAVDEVERLLERYVLAQGGTALFLVKTRIMRGRVEMSESPLPGTFESYEKAPDKEVGIINAPVGQYIAGTDGVRRWQQSPWGAATSVGFGGSEDLMREAANGKGKFKWRNAFSASRLKGRARVDGREMIVLAATPKGEGRQPVLMYFDAETYLLRKQEPDRAAGSKDAEWLKAFYIDSYATVDGVKVPALFRFVADKFTMTFRVTEVRHNVHIDDGLFRNPGGK